MKILPFNNYVLCKPLNKNKKTKQVGNIVFEVDDLVIYEVLDMRIKTDKELPIILKIGDKVISNATGTSIYDKDDRYVLLNIDNIVAKVID